MGLLGEGERTSLPAQQQALLNQTANNLIDLSNWRKIDVMLLIGRCLNHLLTK